MAHTEFITARISNDGTQENINWYKGNMSVHNSNVEFHRGNAVTWSQDTTGGGGGNPFNDSGCYAGSTSSGASHTFNYKLESGKEGLFPSMRGVSGFQYEVGQTSTAGHAYWLKRIGIETCDANGGNLIRWGSHNMSKTNDYDYHTDKRLFNEADLEAFKNQYFYRVWFHVSTSGGSFTASNTYVYIKNFQLIYNVGSGNNRWVVGKYRKKEVAGSEAIQY